MVNLESKRYRIRHLDARTAWPLLNKIRDTLQDLDLAQDPMRLLFRLPPELMDELFNVLLPRVDVEKDFNVWKEVTGIELDELSTLSVYELVLRSITFNFGNAFTQERYSLSSSRVPSYAVVSSTGQPAIFSGILAAGMCSLESLGVISLTDVIDLNENLAVKIENEWRAYESKS